MDIAKIKSFNSLSDKTQHILKACAMYAINGSVYPIQTQVETKMKCSHKEIKEAFALGTMYGFLENEYGNINVSLPFIVFIFPQLEDSKEELKKIVSEDEERRRYYQLPMKKLFRNFLYGVLYNNKLLADYEAQLTPYLGSVIHHLQPLMVDPAYAPYVSKVCPAIADQLIRPAADSLYTNLAPFSEVMTFMKKNYAIFGKKAEEFQIFKIYSFHKNLEGGVFDDSNLSYAEAIQKLQQGDVTGAYVAFQVLLKEIKNPGLAIPIIPRTPMAIFFYCLTLLRLDTLKAMPFFNKIGKFLDKELPQDMCGVITYHALNQTTKRDAAFSYLSRDLENGQSLHHHLCYICTYYIVEKVPNKKMLELMGVTIRKAIAGGYYLLALEAAYVYNKWNQTAESKALFDSVQRFLTYPPMLSHIAKVDDWEKSLNALLSFGTNGKVAKESEARVAYQVNFNQLAVQPVAQVLQKTGWSAGKNIALKTLVAGKTKGMTEQDFRIAKTIQRYNSYYGGDTYGFSDTVLVELVGHPYLFLEGGKISAELIEKKPLIQVTKKGTNYHLSTSLTSCDKSILIEKETNTRYHLYKLTEQQMHILQIIIKQKIVVPESGKEKLIQLLAGFSTQMEVHSDLLATASSQLKIEEVTADNRIHIQLLPLGTGIKAELFSKPFGTRPPYCKPGLGGKNLIANEKGVQLQVKRDLKQESAYADLLMNEIQMIESVDVSDDLIAFDDPLDSLLLLEIIAKNPTICVAEWPEGVKYKIKASVGFPNLSLKLKSGVAWFDLQGELKVDEKTVLSLQQLMTLSEQSHNRFIELNPGEFIALSKELKKQLEDLRAFTVGNKNGVQVNKFAAEPLSDFFDNVEDLKTDKAWKDFQKRITQAKKETFVVPNTLQADLRPYQEEGFKWMARLAEWEAGACLADDMGLGKTVQTIAILLHRAQLGTALVVCPVSVLGNWIRELERFAPTLQIKTLGASSGKGREQVFDTLEKGDVLISTYGLLQSEEKLFCRDTFATLVLDEAHTIKNNATKTSKSTMQLKAQFRIALTGTPLQNHLGEIWNLFHFINPGLLGSLQHFTDTFIKPTDPNVRKQLKKLITPFILRRTKSAVLDELPPKTEIIKKIELSKDEMAFYEAIRRSALENIATASTDNRFQVMAEITKLRQASCNPLLVDPAIQIPSSKLEAFLEIVDDLIENKHRALVFSQFVTHLAIMRQALDAKGIRYQYLDGSCSMPNREESVKKFQSGEGDLFLISLKAGGLGLNLTAADYVIHLDPWWNPAIEDQASDRAHRIGQLRPVTIYRLVSENTIEEKIIQLHNTKRDLAESLLEGSDQSGKLSINELIALIKN